jgi:CTP-dependent riboflavin kinase
MLSEYRSMLHVIKMWTFCNDVPPCGNDVARETFNYMSRSKTYRKLYEMKMKGLVDSEIQEHKIVFTLTEKGIKFLEDYNEIPF